MPVFYPSVQISTGSFPLLGPSDSAAAPNYSYASDPDTGPYRAAANTAGLSAGGVGMTWDGTVLTVPVSSFIAWSGKSRIWAGSTDGNMTLTNSTSNGFGLLSFGNTTNAYPAIKRSSAALAFRLADDSADAAITAAAGTFTGAVTSPDGNSGAPGWRVTSEVTGWYLSAAGTLSAAVAGSGPRMSVTSSAVTSGGDFQTAATGAYQIGSSRSKIKSSVNGYLELLNSAETGFTGLRLGGSTASFPMILNTASVIGFRLADDSADVSITAGAGTFSGTVTTGASSAFAFSGRSQIQSTQDSYLTLLDSAGTAFTGLRFGGASASFPMWKRNGAALNARLANDSADAAITAAAGTFSGVITGPAGLVSAPGLNLGTATAGLYASASGTIDVATASTRRGQVNSSGEWGIGGTATTNWRLTVWGVGTTSSTNAAVIQNSTGAKYWLFRDDGQMQYQGTQLTFLDSSSTIIGSSGTFTFGNLGSFVGGKVVFPSANTGTITWTGPSAASAQAFIWNAPASGSTMCEWQANGVTELTLSSGGNLTPTGDIQAAGGYKQVALTGFRAALTTGLASAAMTIPGTTIAAIWTAPYAGSIRGISTIYNATQSAGTLTIEVTKNGGALVSSAGYTSGSTNYTTFNKDANTFAAGDTIRLLITTDGSFAPTGSDIVAFLMVEC